MYYIFFNKHHKRLNTPPKEPHDTYEDAKSEVIRVIFNSLIPRKIGWHYAQIIEEIGNHRREYARLYPDGREVLK